MIYRVPIISNNNEFLGARGNNLFLCKTGATAFYTRQHLVALITAVNGKVKLSGKNNTTFKQWHSLSLHTSVDQIAILHLLFTSRWM